MIWLALAAMLMVAMAIVAFPLFRHQKKTAAATVGIATALVAVGLYLQLGSPETKPASPESLPGIEDMVDALDARLRQNPEDLAGWKMLGRSYLQLRRFPDARRAFEKAIELENSSDGQTLADLGEVLLLSDQDAARGRAAELFESALAIAPNNPKALFYAGMVALDRGDRELAATRWESLLATSPPPNIREILRQRIAELRGEAAVEVAETPAATGPVLSVRVTLSGDASNAAPPDATVFIIARDPAQPSPPIAAVRRKVAELPAVVEISDSDAMIPGRVPSAFAELEVVARVSMSGQPIAQSGDWFGDGRFAPRSGDTVSVVIDGQVP